jgi:hypothetical protein
MSRIIPAVFGGFVAFLALEMPAAGQAAVEAGIGAAASSIGTSGARGVGKSIGGAFGKLTEALKSPGSTTTTPSAKPVARRADPPMIPAATAIVYEDALQIEKGMEREELLRRFGPPALQIASGSEEQTMSYLSVGGVVQLELQGGRVVGVTKPKPGA